MDSVAVTVPLRPPIKKMKKRKELDALAPSHIISRRTSGKRSSQELLTDSSDERSEYWNVSVRGNRKARARRSHTCPGLLRACSAFFGCASIFATASLIWLFIDVRQQLTSVRTEVDQAMADNKGMRPNVDKCYLLSKNIHQNQTNLFNQLHVINAQITNFTIQLAGVQQDLHDVHELLNNVPKQTNAPNDLKSVWTNVASLGSRIADLEVTRNLLKEQWTTLQDAQNRLQQNMTATRNTIAELSKKPESSTNETLLKTEELQHAISQVNSSLQRINDTLSTSIKFVSDDQRKDHNLLNSLQDKTQNASVKVISLEGQCAKISDQKVINDSLVKLTNEVHNAREANLEMMNKVQQLEKTYDALKNETDIVISSVATAKNRNENRDESSIDVHSSKSNSSSLHRDSSD